MIDAVRDAPAELHPSWQLLSRQPWASPSPSALLARLASFASHVERRLDSVRRCAWGRPMCDTIGAERPAPVVPGEIGRAHV